MVYVPDTRKIMSSYDVFLNENISSKLEYTSKPYAVAMGMQPAVSYISYASSSR